MIVVMMKKCKFNKYIDDYMDKIRSGKIAEVNAWYRKELQEATNELNLYKNKIIKLFEVAGENSL